MTLQRLKDVRSTLLELRANGKQMLKVACAEFLSLVPEAESLSFKLTVPSFNDGDVCLPQASGLDITYTEEAIKELKANSYYKFRESTNPRAIAIIALIDEFDEVLRDTKMLCNIIKYNQQVKVTRDSFEIDDYYMEY